MSTPYLYLGMAADGSNIADIWRSNLGSDDDGTDFVPLMKSSPWAPGGIGGEAVFKWLYITVTYTMAVTINVTPYVDGTAQETLVLTLTSKGSRTTETYRFLILQGYDPGGGEAFKYAPRGEAVQVEVDVDGALASGDCIIDRVEVDAEVVQDARDAENAS